MSIPYVRFPSVKEVYIWRNEIRNAVQKMDGRAFGEMIFKVAPRCIDPSCFDEIKELVTDATKTNVDIDVFGSARIGVSISPVKVPLLKAFGPDSDLDIVIFSQELFDRLQVEHLHLQGNAGLWNLRQADDDFYISRGWYRPDKHKRAALLFELANKITQSVFERRIKCTLALFRDSLHYSAYLSSSRAALVAKIERNKERDIP